MTKNKFKINDNLNVIIQPRVGKGEGKLILSVFGIKPELVELSTNDVVELVDVCCAQIGRIAYRNPDKEMLQVKVYLNGECKTVKYGPYGFSELVELVHGKMRFPEDFTITVTDKNGKNPKIYSFDDKIELKEGMQINVDRTNSA